MFVVISHLLKHIVYNPPAPFRILVLLLTLLLYGSTGFLYFELPVNPDLTWADGLWYTIVTMTTVGYGDYFPKTVGGRFLVGWPVMLIGIGLLGYALSLIATALVTSRTLEVKGMASFKLSDHVVIFNYPGLTKVLEVLEELALDPAVGSHTPMVVVDEFLEEFPPELQQRRGMHFVRGNPTRDDTLSRASIDQARHAIVLSRGKGEQASDHLNLAITLAIEARTRKVNTVVECIDPATEELLRKAGCDRIVCSTRFEATFIAQELLNPGVQEVMADLVSSKGGQQMYVLPVPGATTFGDLAGECRRKGHLALGLSSAEGVRLNVPETHPVQACDRLVTLGPSRITIQGQGGS